MHVAVAGSRDGAYPEHMDELERWLRVLEPTHLHHGASPSKLCVDWQAFRLASDLGIECVPHPAKPADHGGHFGRAANARQAEMAKACALLFALPGDRGTRGTIEKFEKAGKLWLPIPRGWT